MALQVKRTKSTRTFPPPKAAASTCGRRTQILEKAVAAEEKVKKKAVAAERKRLKTEEKKRAAQRAARKAALKAAFLPLTIARDGVREFAKASYNAALKLGKNTIGGVKLAARGLGKLVILLPNTGRRVIAAGIRISGNLLRYLDPRPLLVYLGYKALLFFALLFSITILGLVLVRGAVAWLPRLNPLPYLGRLSAGIVRQLRHVSRHLQPRRLLTYSYAAAIGVSLVVVGGQLALKIAADKKERRATEEMAAYQADLEAPAETELATAILQAEGEIPGKTLAADKRTVAVARLNPVPEPTTPAKGLTAQHKAKVPQRSAALAPPLAAPTLPATLAPPRASAPDYATAYPVSPARPVIAVVIDDMGMMQGAVKRFAKLPAEVTFAFLPYAPNLEYQTRVMRDSGHELIVHLPMEPKRDTANPGPQALLTRLSDAELQRRIAWNLGRFEGFSGINNHMGSRFTEDPRVMGEVMSALKTRGLYFLDSMTTSRSVGVPMATKYGVSQAQRDIFLDNERDYAAIMRQLRKAERIAERRGHVIAIGHPYRITYQVLKDWAPTLQRKGIRLVALSRLIRRPVADLRVAESNGPAKPAGTIASSGAGGSP